ncbi:Uu.00g032930.m01.CDS01 [Anthostomella pinea]|uniref:Uu.00g032930.m01.CDS01 n=1 Tax=Anthostomella pinea TaxID=933095 RepID=A0AAI8V9S2_9PEZI|nr:Uu.00g032930.m01.CDS01 [Anthostomella pinea]
MGSIEGTSHGAFTTLPREILRLASNLDSQIASHGRGATTSDIDTLEELPADVNATRDEFIDKTQTAKRLAQGARGALWELGFQFTDEMTLRAIHEFRLAEQVPLDGSATLGEIAQDSDLDAETVERILRHAMSSHIFSEAPGSPPGRVVHTAISRLLATGPDALSAVGMVVHDLAPIGTRLNDALRAQRHLPANERYEPTNAATALVFGEGASFFGVLAGDKERAARFGGGMRHFAHGAAWDVKHLLTAYDWSSVDHSGAVLVDVGGGIGAVPRALVDATQHLGYIVQDLPDTVADGVDALPPSLSSRVAFEAHNFFDPQERRGVDVYFLRWVLHNWSDNNMDLVMLAAWNSAERTEAMWKVLIEMADPRLRFEGVRQLEGSLLSIVEAVWEEP